MINLGLENVPALKKNPLPFLFAVNNTAMVNTLTETSTTPAGYEGAVTAYVTGNDAQIRRNNTGAWGSSVTLSNGDLLNLQMTSSPSNDTPLQCTITIGSTSTVWTLRTIVDPAIVLTNIVNAPIMKAFVQTPVNRSNVPLTFTITGSGSQAEISNNNTTWGASALVQPGATFWVRQTSSSKHEITTLAILSVLTANYNWTITTSTVVGSVTVYTANQNFVVPPYDTMVVELWSSGGASYDYVTPQYGPSSFGEFLMCTSGRCASNYYVAAEGGEAFGGDVNIPGNKGLGGTVTPGNWPPSHPTLIYAPQTKGGTQGAGRGGQSGAYYDSMGNITNGIVGADGGSGAYAKKVFINNMLPEGSIVPMTFAVPVGYIPGYPGRITIEILKEGRRDYEINTTFTIPTYNNSLTLRLWGGGACGSFPGYNQTQYYVNATPTTVSSLGLSAGQGQYSLYPYTIGGAGGIASGGTINTNGTPGNNPPVTVPVYAPNSTVWGRGGYNSLANQQAGGGSGAYVEKTFTVGQLIPGNLLTFTIGQGGTSTVQGTNTANVAGAIGHVQVLWT